MKSPSKMDEARAQREARYGASSAVAALPVAKQLAALPPEERARGAARFVESQIAVALLAPEGQCLSCDRRRALLNAAKRRRNAAKGTLPG